MFTESDQTKMGVMAVAAAIAGMGGQAMATTSNASAMEEEADYIEFDLDGQVVKGWVWRNPFREGDVVTVAAEPRAAGLWEAYGVQRPSDKTVALYPHCSRGRARHFKNAAWWWIFGWGGFVTVIGVPMAMFIMGIAVFRTIEMGLTFAGLMAFFGIMTFSLSRKWLPFVRLAEKVFRALGLPDPTNIDLVRSSNRQRTEHDPGEFGTFYFRY